MEELYKFMYFGDYDKNIQILANMSLPEKWSCPDKKENYILKSYLKYTFFKLQSESKVLITEDYILFNTGLFTTLYDPIYVYGEKRILPVNNENLSPWFLKDL